MGQAMKMSRSDTDQIDRDDILALLEDGPKETGKLAAWLRHPQARVIAACTEMAQAGVLKRLPHPDRRWALLAFQPSAEMLDRIKRVQPTVKPRVPLRQALDAAPPSQKSTSWWLDLDRNAFQDRAKAEQPRMAESKIGSRGTTTNLGTD
jgi:hypothetical protein